MVSILINSNIILAAGMEEVICISDILPSVFEIILDFVYVGKIALSTRNLSDILLASRLKIGDLEKGCNEALKAFLNIPNWFRFRNDISEYTRIFKLIM